VWVATATGGTRGNPRLFGPSKESARLIVVMNAGNAAGAKGPCESIRVVEARKERRLP